MEKSTMPGRLAKEGMAQGYFVTGTDTGVGKTLVTSALVHAFAARGFRVVGMKPVATGCAWLGDRWANEDVAALQSEASVAVPESLVSPCSFRPPLAPHIAAEREGVVIDLDHIVASYHGLREKADTVMVEGVGGFMVPLGPACDMADLAARLGLPILLVVALRLGCLNHALLTAQAIRARGLHLCGWVANATADMSDPIERQDNILALSQRLHAPLVGVVPVLNEPSATNCAAFLRLQTLGLGLPEPASVPHPA